MSDALSTNVSDHSVETGGMPGEDFIRAFTQSQRALYLFVLPLVGNPNDADEVIQETNLVIWAKWRQFEPGTNFLAWVRAIARLEVLRFRRSRGRKVVFMDDSLLDLVAHRAEQISGETDQRQEALAECVQSLRPRDRELIRMRYAPGANGDLVARQLGRPANSVYQSLSRIRRALVDCVRHRMAEQTGGIS